MNNNKLSTKDLCIISIFVAGICVLGQLSIPMPYGVPMTLQTFIITIAGVILGAKKGTIATLIYILIGVVGMPVFSGFTGGIGVILGPTGGFILSFPIMSYLSGKGAETGKLFWIIVFMTLGTIINYIFGMIVFSIATGSSMWIAFISCVLPFIPTSVIKIVISSMLGVKIKVKLIKQGLL